MSGKNWDKIVKEFEKSEEEANKNTSDEVEFFQRLYESLDDDAKKAMNKSFQESKGTKISTNWEEVKKQ